MHHVFERGTGSVERLFDAIHCGAGLRLEIVDHVLLDLITLVRMVVIDRQRGGAGKPKKLSALDLDGRYERHEHALVVVRMVDNLHVLVLRLGGCGGENYGGYAKHREREHGAKRCP